MKNISSGSLVGDFSAVENTDNNEIKIIEEEIQNGIVDNDSQLVTFKVEQTISNIESSNQLNIGGFVNANSKFKKFQTRYLALLLSNRRTALKDPKGNVIATKRYGIGIGLVLNVKDIETKVNGNYGVLAASAKLDFAKVGYKLEVYGLRELSLGDSLPDTSGDFSTEAFKKLSGFINKAKLTLKSTDSAKLYPIEVIKEEDLKLEKSDIQSIYFGVRKVGDGVSLFNAIQELRKKDCQLSENVVQFIYRYFELTDAYAVPTETQKQNANKWLNAKYNKINKVGPYGSWVNIDSSFTGDFGDTKFNYKPHKKPSNWSGDAKVLKDEYSETSADFSSDLRIAAVAEVETNFNSIVLTRDIALYMDTCEDLPENSQVIETRYGVGVRLMIKLSNIEFGTDINFGAIGAISELNLANVEYSISGIGFADRDLFELLPGPQNITQETVNDLNNSLSNILTRLKEMNVDLLNPQAYKIRVMEAEKVDPTVDAQAYVFSARQIRNKVRLYETLKRAEEAGIDEELIKKAYNDFDISGNDRISYQQRNEASDWLNI